jgi:hypothetical protein
MDSYAIDQPETYHYSRDSSSDQDADAYIDTVCHSVVSSTPSVNTTLIHTFSSEQCHLPSSPSSSCDSVEIILDDPQSSLRNSFPPPCFQSRVHSNKDTVQLPESFLRNSFPPPCFQSIVHSNKDTVQLSDSLLRNSFPHAVLSVYSTKQQG